MGGRRKRVIGRGRRRKTTVKRKKRGGQRGGAVARRRGPSITDKIGYVASQFLAGPAPTFTTIAKVLGSQAFKGVKDNLKHAGVIR